MEFESFRDHGKIKSKLDIGLAFLFCGCIDFLGRCWEGKK